MEKGCRMKMVELFPQNLYLFFLMVNMDIFSGLPHGSFTALAKFLNNYDAGEAMIRVVSIMYFCTKYACSALRTADLC